MQAGLDETRTSCSSPTTATCTARRASSSSAGPGRSRSASRSSRRAAPAYGPARGEGHADQPCGHRADDAGLCGIERRTGWRARIIPGCRLPEKAGERARLGLPAIRRSRPRMSDSGSGPGAALSRADGWKYAALEGQPWLLYNLNEDPYELANLALDGRFPGAAQAAGAAGGVDQRHRRPVHAAAALTAVDHERHRDPLRHAAPRPRRRLHRRPAAQRGWSAEAPPWAVPTPNMDRLAAPRHRVRQLLVRLDAVHARAPRHLHGPLRVPGARLGAAGGRRSRPAAPGLRPAQPVGALDAGARLPGQLPRSPTTSTCGSRARATTTWATPASTSCAAARPMPTAPTRSTFACPEGDRLSKNDGTGATSTSSGRRDEDYFCAQVFHRACSTGSSATAGTRTSTCTWTSSIRTSRGTLRRSILKLFDPRGYDVPGVSAPRPSLARAADARSSSTRYRARYAAKVAFLDRGWARSSTRWTGSTCGATRS